MVGSSPRCRHSAAIRGPPGFAGAPAAGGEAAVSGFPPPHPAVPASARRTSRLVRESACARHASGRHGRWPCGSCASGRRRGPGGWRVGVAEHHQREAVWVHAGRTAAHPEAAARVRPTHLRARLRVRASSAMPFQWLEGLRPTACAGLVGSSVAHVCAMLPGLSSAPLLAA